MNLMNFSLFRIEETEGYAGREELTVWIRERWCRGVEEGGRFSSVQAQGKEKTIAHAGDAIGGSWASKPRALRRFGNRFTR
jgi:hypothetical protein